jgi:MerR family transcriptional regulator, heat shock protein HspR
MDRRGPAWIFISVAAEMLDMHPQTLRKYERLGLVRPPRTVGSMRVYSRQELDRLRLIKTMVDDAGINLAGVQRLLSIADVAHRMRTVVRRPRRRPADRDQLARDVQELLRLLGMEESR